MNTSILNASFKAVVAVRLNNGKYRYFGVKWDGGRQVLRKNSTRLYANAFEYDSDVAGGSNGIAARFVYGKAARNFGPSHRLVASYPVEVVEG